MTAIGVGDTCINRQSGVFSGRTWCGDVRHHAGGTGKITSVCIYAMNNMSGVKVGIFFNVHDFVYECRSMVELGNVPIGQSFHNCNLDVVTGDLIMEYHTGGYIEAYYDTSYQAMDVEEDACNPGNQYDFGAIVYGGYIISLHGTGETTTAKGGSSALPIFAEILGV